MMDTKFIEQALKHFGVSNYAIYDYPKTEHELFDLIKIVVGTDNTGTCVYESDVNNYPFIYEEFKNKVEEYSLAYEAKEYQRKRAAEYPSIQEQLDMQYWDSVNGTTTWQDAIDAIKAKYPKPEVE